jgi:zinc D-Ala-D-Ala dipeptidase
VDLRYATADNFTHTRLYPRDARCLVHRTMVDGLTTAADELRQQDLRLVFWDCYRPHAVQVRMFRIVPNPTWVARPGRYATSHESARSVDVTLARARGVRDGKPLGSCLLDMGTGFDDFTPRAYAYATVGVSPAEQADRTVLRAAMQAGGLAVYTGEWWHFDGPGALVPMQQLNVPVD